MKTHDVMLLGLALCLSSSAGLGQVNETNEVTVVTPASAAQGTTGQLVTFMLDTDFPPAPPAGVSPVSVTIGGIIGTSVTHATQYTVTALFDIPISAATGAKDATIMWITPGGGSVVFSKAAGFTVTAGADTPPTITSDPLARSVAPGAKVIFNVIASGSPPMSYQWQKGEVDLGAPTGESSYTIDSAALGDAGEYRCIVVNDFGGDTSEIAVLTVDPSLPAEPDNYAIVDTGQGGCSSDSASITAPAPGEAFAGQDAQYAGNRAQYTVGGDGLTVYDHTTGLTWQRSPDTDGDGDIDASDKLTWTELQAYPATLNAVSFGGYSDWRLPSIKELYSLIDFRGTDPPLEGTDTSGLIPFINDMVFDFAYGDTAAGERVIDSQYGSSTLYVAGSLLFGVNFADGRIKGYGLTLGGADKTFLVSCCRGNMNYGVNQFIDNGDGTITDLATGLMWQQGDSLDGMNWEDALGYAEGLDLAGYRDWRLPNAKELQSIVDYTRSPGTTSSAAIDPLFSASAIINMNSETDYPFYWTSTTHLSATGNVGRACYVAFGRGTGTLDEGATIIDIHGAGCQRSDPKDGDAADYPDSGNGPQGDVSRVFNHVRCVRAGATAPAADSDGDGLPDWFEYNYSGSSTAMEAGGNDDGDRASNEDEMNAGTSPVDAGSCFQASVSTLLETEFELQWSSELGKSYTIEVSTDLVTFEEVLSGIEATPPINSQAVPDGGSDSQRFFRVIVE